MQTEFKAGQTVWIMLRDKPVETRIRAVKYVESLEIAKDAQTGKETELINSSCVYGTFADRHKPLTSDKIGSTSEELLHKLFGGKSADTNSPNPTREEEAV